MIDFIIWYLILGCITVPIYTYAKYRTVKFINKVGYEEMKTLVLLLNPSMTEKTFDKNFGKGSTVTVSDVLFIVALWPLAYLKFLVNWNKSRRMRWK